MSQGEGWGGGRGGGRGRGRWEGRGEGGGRRGERGGEGGREESGGKRSAKKFPLSRRRRSGTIPTGRCPLTQPPPTPPRYSTLLESTNYITRRLSLKLLGELLLDRSNFQVMMKYIGERENLKTMMNLLRDPSGNIQYEAFHVFKVFVANPRKPPAIVKILYQNKAKLVA